MAKGQKLATGTVPMKAKSVKTGIGKPARTSGSNFPLRGGDVNRKKKY